MNRVRHTSRKFEQHRRSYEALKRIKARRRVLHETFQEARAKVVAAMHKEDTMRKKVSA